MILYAVRINNILLISFHIIFIMPNKHDHIYILYDNMRFSTVETVVLNKTCHIIIYNTLMRVESIARERGVTVAVLLLLLTGWRKHSTRGRAYLLFVK